MTAEIPPGFTPHDGGPCPVSRETAVLTVRRDGQATICPIAAGTWSVGRHDWWKHEGDSEFDRLNHIIGYRVEPYP